MKEKELTNIERGTLNTFDMFYSDVDFQNQGEREVYDLIEKEMPEEIEEMKNSPEFWWTEFIFDGETYVMAADGDCKSQGRYVVAKII